MSIFYFHLLFLISSFFSSSLLPSGSKFTLSFTLFSTAHELSFNFFSLVVIFLFSPLSDVFFLSTAFFSLYYSILSFPLSLSLPLSLSCLLPSSLLDTVLSLFFSSLKGVTIFQYWSLVYLSYLSTSLFLSFCFQLLSPASDYNTKIYWFYY